MYIVSIYLLFFLSWTKSAYSRILFCMFPRAFVEILPSNADSASLCTSSRLVAASFCLAVVIHRTPSIQKSFFCKVLSLPLMSSVYPKCTLYGAFLPQQCLPICEWCYLYSPIEYTSMLSLASHTDATQGGTESPDCLGAPDRKRAGWVRLLCGASARIVFYGRMCFSCAVLRHDSVAFESNSHAIIV